MSYLRNLYIYVLNVFFVSADEICNKKHCAKNIVDLDDPKIIAEKLESLPTMEFLNIIHKKLVCQYFICSLFYFILLFWEKHTPQNNSSNIYIYNVNAE